MDKITNPFSPGAGSPPPELAGRENILEQARVLLGRIKAKKAEKSLLLTGLRGVGKTVLLNSIEKLAEEANYRTIFFEAHDNKELATLLVPHLRRLLFEFDRISGVNHKVKRGLRVLKSFISAVKVKVGDIDIGLDIEPEIGNADSGDLELDLPALFVALGEAARERDVAVAIFIDEIQYFSSKELSALIMAMHKMQQKQLPILLIGAGLPILPALAGESKSYAERLFNFPIIGPLEKEDAFKALQEPVQNSNEKFSQDALSEIFFQTQGYPYFLQEWGYQSWNLAEQSPIDLDIIKHVSVSVTKRLEENFFRVRFDRLTPKERRFLRAMAEIGTGPYLTSSIADKLGVTLNTLSPTRANLIKKGMIYSPAHGDMDFTVPLFGEFLLRIIPNFD